MIYNNEFRIDFIGIGIGKSGTTWLAEILRKHPEIYYPSERKEVNYFNSLLPMNYKIKNPDYKKDINWYHKFFKERKAGQITGEITPSYMNMENAAEDIFQYNPEVKIFAILRHPVERSFSEFLYSKQNGVSPYKDFETAVSENPMKFLNAGLYFKNLQAFIKLFPKENIGIFFYDDLKKDPKKFLESIYAFLNVGDFFPDEYDTAVNPGKVAKSQYLNNVIGRSKISIYSKNMGFVLFILRKTGLLKMIRKVKEKNLKERVNKEVIAPDLRKKLCDFFKEDINALEKLTNRNLQLWKQ